MFVNHSTTGGWKHFRRCWVICGYPHATFRNSDNHIYIHIVVIQYNSDACIYIYDNIIVHVILCIYIYTLVIYVSIFIYVHYIIHILSQAEIELFQDVGIMIVYFSNSIHLGYHLVGPRFVRRDAQSYARRLGYSCQLGHPVNPVAASGGNILALIGCDMGMKWGYVAGFRDS